MKISKAAEASGVGVETIRFYERKGLIARPLKPVSGGIRDYGPDIVDRICFIRQAQAIGFSLREINELLSLRADPEADCADVRVRAIEKRDEVQAKLSQLSRMRDALDELIASCPGGGNVKACTILDAIQREPSVAHITSPKPTANSKKGTQEMKTTVLNIDGMHCDGCARTIEALLGCVPGVRKAEASYNEGQARVLHDLKEADVADLMAAVAKAGFTANAAET